MEYMLHKVLFYLAAISPVKTFIAEWHLLAEMKVVEVLKIQMNT